MAAAKRCPHCGENLRTRFGIEWEGDVLVVMPGANMPGDVCTICASHDGIECVVKTYTHTPSWLYLFLLLGCIPGAILAFLVSLSVNVQAKLPIPVCARCRRRWALVPVLYVLGALVCLILFPILFAFVGSLLDRSSGGGTGAVLGFLAWAVGIFVAHRLWVQPVQVSCRSFDGRLIRLQVPDAEALRREW